MKKKFAEVLGFDVLRFLDKPEDAKGINPMAYVVEVVEVIHDSPEACLVKTNNEGNYDAGLDKCIEAGWIEAFKFLAKSEETVVATGNTVDEIIEKVSHLLDKGTNVIVESLDENVVISECLICERTIAIPNEEGAIGLCIYCSKE